MKWEAALPERGDIIRVKHRFYYHYGIYIDDDTVVQFGLAEDAVGRAEDVKVIVGDISTFLSLGEVERAVLTIGERAKSRPREKVCEYALSCVGEGDYNILHNNCEHFAYRCVFGEASAPSLDGIREKIRNKLKKN